MAEEILSQELRFLVEHTVGCLGKVMAGNVELARPVRFGR